MKTPGKMMIESMEECLQQLKEFHYETYLHSIQVGILAAKIGKAMGKSEQEVKELYQTGCLHDIGKQFIDIRMLKKAGKLTGDEKRKMQEHPVVGYQYLLKYREIPPNIRLGVLQHHERCDGSGYPAGLRRGNISETAKIIAVSDVYHAMITKRPYHEALSEEKAIAYLNMHQELFDWDILTGFQLIFLP